MDQFKRITNVTLKVELQSLFLDCVDPTHKVNRSKLPLNKLVGVAFPKALIKARLEKLNLRQMKWSPKLDGVRALLMFTMHGVFLVDRHFDFYLVSEHTADEGLTVLDGEIMQSPSGATLHIAFDLVCHNGEYTYKLPRIKRYQQLEALVPKLSAATGSKCKILFKPFFPISDMFEQKLEIKDDVWMLDGIPLKIDAGGSVWMSDNQTYLSAHDSTLLKMKLHHTTDVLGCPADVIEDGEARRWIKVWYMDKERKNQVQLDASGRALISSELLKEARQHTEQTKSATCCCECVMRLPTQDGKRHWEVTQIRKDKPNANYYDVVQESIAAQMDAVTVETIKQVWLKQVSKKRKRVPEGTAEPKPISKV